MNQPSKIVCPIIDENTPEECLKHVGKIVFNESDLVRYGPPHTIGCRCYVVYAGVDWKDLYEYIIRPSYWIVVLILCGIIIVGILSGCVTSCPAGTNAFWDECVPEWPVTSPYYKGDVSDETNILLQEKLRKEKVK